MGEIFPYPIKTIYHNYEPLKCTTGFRDRENFQDFPMPKGRLADLV
jgi:hypothetical protein